MNKESWERTVMSFVSQDAEWLKACAAFCRGELTRNELEKRIARALVNPWDRWGLNTYDAWVWCLWEREIGQKDIGFQRIQVKLNDQTDQVGPKRDAEREYNNNALQHLYPPFRGTFIGGKGEGEDGTLYWNSEIRVITGWTPNEEVRTIPPGQVPLEVGTFSAYQSWRHYQYRDGMATWPYEEDCVWLFVWLNGNKAVERASKMLFV